MASIATASSGRTTTLFTVTAPTPQPSYKFLPFHKQKISQKCSNLFLSFDVHEISSASRMFATLTPRSVSSTETPTAEEEERELESGAPGSDDFGSLPPLTGCKACGREEIERGCNGEGRLQGGIATFPGFGWWPIKAYRPCPAFLASGGRYRRSGQSLDEVVSGSGGRSTSDRPQSRKGKGRT